MMENYSIWVVAIVLLSLISLSIGIADGKKTVINDCELTGYSRYGTTVISCAVVSGRGQG